ncbi:kinase-like domain-containing protein [Apiospora phragmitis]|uniref:Kinase-like domain-containing protein n=1 Tax=Apiospora phragmitis TaxID=2905665 RepID=A0ABR1URE4_9PEZI
MFRDSSQLLENLKTAYALAWLSRTGIGIQGKQDILQTTQESSRIFRKEFDYTHFIFKRTLGWGGFGLALKYEQVDANGQHVAYASVKVPRAAHVETIASFKHETRYYMRFEASEHIPRLLHFPPGMTEEQDDGTKALPEGNDQFWVNSSGLHLLVHHAMILEYLEYGDLNELMHKTLWRFFLCSVVVTRGCIAMAYPRKSEAQLEAMIQSQQAQHRNGGASAANADIPWREVMLLKLRSRLIHRDLDPGNVFLGKPDAGDTEHSFHPVAKVSNSPIPHPWVHVTCFIPPAALTLYVLFQIADFGAMWDAAKGQGLLYVDAPGLGKTRQAALARASDTLFFLYQQEQFDDYVHQGAGSFGDWTNIWGIGMIMFNIMTLTVWRPHTRESRFVPIPTPTDPNRIVETFGWYLDDTQPWPTPRSADAMKFYDYDKDLRELGWI